MHRLLLILCVVLFIAGCEDSTVKAKPVIQDDASWKDRQAQQDLLDSMARDHEFDI